MEISDDPDKQERENIDKAKMDKIALQSQIEPDDEDEEISQDHIDNLKKNSEMQKGENQEIFTSSFDVDEVDYDRDSQAIYEVDAIYRSRRNLQKRD